MSKIEDRIEDKIKYLKEELDFYELFNVTPGKPWIREINGPTLEQIKEKIKNQLEVLEELKQKEDERLCEGVDIPKPPKPPLSRIIREGTIGDCLKCHSTTIKRFIWFGRKIGCIQPKCENYYYKPKQR